MGEGGAREERVPRAILPWELSLHLCSTLASICHPVFLRPMNKELGIIFSDRLYFQETST